MAIEPVAATPSAAQGLGIQDFLKILLTQLTYQDPLKPLDNQEFMAQMAQFSSLEQTRQLTEKIDVLLGIQSATQSVGLLGRTVDIDSAAGPVAGQVTALDLSNGTPQLTIKLASGQVLTGITLGQVLSVR
jgi:flagellar basal-body rod modification protein FlgD